MNRKRRFGSWFRGWLPKDPTFPSPVRVQVNQKTNHRPNIAVYLAIFGGVFAAVFLAMSATYGLGLGDSYATAAAATAGVMAGIVINVLLRKPNQNKPVAMTEGGRRVAKTIAAANAGMVCLFLGTYFLVNPNIKSAELTLSLWIVLLLSMFLVNTLLYRNFKKEIGLMETV